MKNMKKLPIYDLHHRKQLEDFSNYLPLVGYGDTACKMLPRLLREFLYWCEQKHCNYKEISHTDIKEHYRYLETRPSERGGALSELTLNRHLYALRVFYTYQQETKQLTANPFSSLEIPKATYMPRAALNRREIQALYTAAETYRERAILSLFYGCGLRRSEAEKLNVKEVSFKNNILYIREGKGKKRREIPLSSKVKSDLEIYYYKERGQYLKQRTELAFMVGDRGRRMRGETFNKYLKRLLKQTGNQDLIEKEISLHHLRHSIATHLLENGLPIEKVRDFLGHQELDTTQVYTHIHESIPL